MAETAYARAMRKQRKLDARTTTQRASDNGKTFCEAKKRGGGNCRMYAGHGTDHPGIGRCKYHGGNLPSHKKNALKRQAILMGAPKEIDPVSAITWVIHITAGEVEWLSSQIEQLDRQEWYENSILGKQMNILVRERKEAVFRLEKFARDAISLGIAERRVRLAENYGNTIARLLRGVLDDLQLTKAQLKAAPQIVRKHLILLEASTPQTALPVIEGTAKEAA